MTPQQWQQVKALFHSALQLAPESRAAFLDEACAREPSLREEVESLIAAHEQPGSFIDSPAYERAGELLSDKESELKAGQAVGSYEILSLLGRGGMGEVYLARHRRLNRQVALKFLPASFTKDAERLERFEREASAASALNHPNIITIHEIGEIDSLHFIATEFIEGETLRERLSQTRPDLKETLHIVVQITDALVAAHKASIIHRDIKPENIMLRPDGYVKVLDFGLAKLVEQQASASLSEAQQRKHFNTSPGVFMGTVRYVSPEQARGEEVDARTDIWSLGVVLYEMLSGHVPFDGETDSHIIINILENEPASFSSGEAPAELDWVVRKALKKDREERYQTARELLSDLRSLKQRVDFQAELERTQPSEKSAAVLRAGSEKQFATGSIKMAAETSEVYPAHSTKTEAVTRKAGHRRHALSLAALALVAGIIVFAAYRFFGHRQSTTETQTAQSSSEHLPELKAAQVTTWSGLDIYPSFSPDGNSIAYSSDHNGAFEIYIKQLTPGGREIQLTTDGQQNFEPAWSPDGKLIAYHSKLRGGIWLVPAFGGAARQLTDFGSCPAWSPDGSMIAFQSNRLNDLFSPTATGGGTAIWTISVAGGSPQQLTQAGNPVGLHGSPSWSPDGKRIVFATSVGDKGEIWSVSASGGQLKQLDKQGGFDPIYSPDGESIYFTGNDQAGDSWGLLRLRVSPQNGEPLGEAVVIKNTGATLYKHLRISADGKKIACTALQLANNLSAIPVAPGSGEAKGSPVVLTQDTNYRKLLPAFSPDGRKIAYVLVRIGTNNDIWVMDADGKNPTQLTTDPHDNRWPSWFPEGDRIAYHSVRQGRQMMRAINLQTGRDQLLFELDQYMGWPRLSPDGKQVAFNSTKSGTINVWMIPIEGGDPKQLTFDQELMGFPSWSPDSRFIAFEMRRGDDTNVAIMPSDGGQIVQLTSDRGQSFVGSWSPDGTKIAFAGERNDIWNIWWVSVKDRTEKQLTSYTKPNADVRYPSWSPLGDRIVYEYSETTSNIWLIDLK
jgi:Tol biopolymer transport system component